MTTVDCICQFNMSCRLYISILYDITHCKFTMLNRHYFARKYKKKMRTECQQIKFGIRDTLDWLQSFLQFFIYLFILFFILFYFLFYLFIFYFFFFFFCHFFCHFLSLPVALLVSLIPFHCFTTGTIFSTKGHNLSIHYKLY